jgi:uncharacterized protein (DUF433 family)
LLQFTCGDIRWAWQGSSPALARRTSAADELASFFLSFFLSFFGGRSDESMKFVGRAGQLAIEYSSGMSRFDRITVDPKKLNGQPCIRGLRITVRRVLEALAAYPDREELRQEYPELEDADIRQALEYAAAALDDRVTDLPAA